MSAGPLFPGDDPLSDDELRDLGYDIAPDGSWQLVDPDRKPKPRPELCRMCGQFEAQPDWDGWCAGCAYNGPGDPHGLRPRSEPPRGPDQERIPERREGLREALRRAIRARGEESS
jgi:hypothetical protein